MIGKNRNLISLFRNLEQKKARQGLTLIETEKKSPVFPTYLVINKVRNVVFSLHTIGNGF